MHRRFAIVTVVYNAEKEIGKTIESVLVQNNHNFQYIIMDGRSNDKTLEIAKKYSIEFNNKQIDYRIYSEEDTGIYDAMNNSINHIDSDYVIFLNAGDMLFEESTLTQVEASIAGEKYDVIYGNYYFFFEDMRKPVKSREADSLKKGMITTHQAIFTKVEVFQNQKYNNYLYKMAADYDFYLTLFEKGASFFYINQPIVYFATGGESQQRAIITQKDVLNIKRKHQLVTDKSIPLQIIMIALVCIKKFILSKLPKRIRYYKYEHCDSNMLRGA